MKKTRNVSLDVLRVIACIMVVLMHSPMPNMATPGFVLSGLSYLTAPCIGLFFMVSGALLLPQKTDDIASFDTKKFLKKRFSKILWPTLVWTIIGFLLEMIGIKNDERAVLWFMYTLSGMYLLTPILSRWIFLAKQTELEFYLGIWFLTLLMPFIKLIVNVNESDTSWLYYFHGYVGYYILGGVINRFEYNKKRKFLFIVAIILFSLCSPLFILIYHWDVDFYTLFWYLSITVALVCILWWKICHKVKRVSSFIMRLSEWSFGIYLTHILIMRNIVWKMDWICTIFCVNSLLRDVL